MGSCIPTLGDSSLLDVLIPWAIDFLISCGVITVLILLALLVFSRSQFSRWAARLAISTSFYASFLCSSCICSLRLRALVTKNGMFSAWSSMIIWRCRMTIDDSSSWKRVLRSQKARLVTSSCSSSWSFPWSKVVTKDCKVTLAFVNALALDPVIRPLYARDPSPREVTSLWLLI